MLGAQPELIKQLIEKTLGHTKASIKNKAGDCWLKMFEVSESFDEGTAGEHMLEMLKHKNLKVFQTAMTTLTLWLAAFGPKKVPLKLFLKTMEEFAASTVPSVKTEALNFFKECYRWLGDGPAIEALIKNLK